MNGTEGVIYLCGCALHGQIPDREIIASLDPAGLYHEASRHMLAAAVGMALGEAGIETKEFTQAVAAAQRKTIILDLERKRVSAAMQEAGIWHAVLKGSVLGDWYPKFAMRESADVDILYDKTRAADLKEIMASLGFTVKEFDNGHHDVYHKQPLCNFEMHTDLFGSGGYDAGFNRYFGRIKDRLIRKNGFEYEFSPEDFYIYFLAHEHQHYIGGGVGLRSVADTYVMLKKLDLDREYVKNELEKIGLTGFEEQNRSLALHLFDGGMTDADGEMLKYIVSSGTFGVMEHRVENGIREKGGLLRYIFGRIFLSPEKIRRSYPFFHKHKILLPFLPFYRLFRGLRRGSALREFRLAVKSRK